MKATNVRTRPLGTRLTEAEYQRVASAAASQDLTESDWLRALIQSATCPNPTVQVLAEEFLALRQIFQNIIAYQLEEKLITKEVLQKACSNADREKKVRARALFGLFLQGQEHAGQ